MSNTGTDDKYSSQNADCIPLKTVIQPIWFQYYVWFLPNCSKNIFSFTILLHVKFKTIEEPEDKHFDVSLPYKNLYPINYNYVNISPPGV